MSQILTSERKQNGEQTTPELFKIDLQTSISRKVEGGGQGLLFKHLNIIGGEEIAKFFILIINVG